VLGTQLRLLLHRAVQPKMTMMKTPSANSTDHPSVWSTCSDNHLLSSSSSDTKCKKHRSSSNNANRSRVH
jgi:hypothetical protein